MNLYLDDIRPLPPEFDTLARSIDDARRLLMTGDVITASLDHDLGACAECMTRYGVTSAIDWLYRSAGASMPNCPHIGTGKDLVLWMIKTGHWPKEKPTVHSANPVGAKIMRQLIDEHFAAAEVAASNPLVEPRS